LLVLGRYPGINVSYPGRQGVNCNQQLLFTIKPRILHATSLLDESVLTSLFISFQIGSYILVCWLGYDSKAITLAENIVTQFGEKVSNFESANKQLFSVAGRVFKPDRCRLTNKRFETLMSVNCNEHFQLFAFCLINF